MDKHKILFRGFRADENGKTTITLNGDKIKGEWLFGIPIKTHIGIFICYEDNPHYCSQYMYMEIQDIAKVIPETIGQWVATDKNGKDVFYDDTVKDSYGRVMRVVYKHFKPMLELVSYDKTKAWTNNFKYADLGEWFNDNVDDKAELIGNKWESEVTE